MSFNGLVVSYVPANFENGIFLVTWYYDIAKLAVAKGFSKEERFREKVLFAFLGV